MKCFNFWKWVFEIASKSTIGITYEQGLKWHQVSLNVHTCSWRESGYSSHSQRDALNFCDFRNSSFGRTAYNHGDLYQGFLHSVRFKDVLMSVTFSKLVPQSVASTLAGVGARECDASLAYILFHKRTGLLQTSFMRLMTGWSLDKNIRCTAFSWQARYWSKDLAASESASEVSPSAPLDATSVSVSCCSMDIFKFVDSNWPGAQI